MQTQATATAPAKAATAPAKAPAKATRCPSSCVTPTTLEALKAGLGSPCHTAGVSLAELTKQGLLLPGQSLREMAIRMEQATQALNTAREQIRYEGWDGLGLASPDHPSAALAALNNAKTKHRAHGLLMGYHKRYECSSDEDLVRVLRIPFIKENDNDESRWIKQEVIYRVLPQIVASVSRYLRVTFPGVPTGHDKRDNFLSGAIAYVLNAMINRRETSGDITTVGRFAYQYAQFGCKAVSAELFQVKGIPSQQQLSFISLDSFKDDFGDALEFEVIDAYTFNDNCDIYNSGNDDE